MVGQKKMRNRWLGISERTILMKEFKEVASVFSGFNYAQICLECSQRWAFNADGVCKSVWNVLLDGCSTLTESVYLLMISVPHNDDKPCIKCYK